MSKEQKKPVDLTINLSAIKRSVFNRLKRKKKAPTKNLGECALMTIGAISAHIDRYNQALKEKSITEQDLLRQDILLNIRGEIADFAGEFLPEGDTFK